MREPETRLTRRSLLCVAGSAAVTAALGAPALARSTPAVTDLRGRAFATGWRISLPGGVETAGLRAAVQALLDTVDRQMSPYRADSDLTRLNMADAGRCAAPDALRHVTGAALDIADASDGAFDPTVGPLVARWGFGPIEGDPQPGWAGVSLAQGGITKDHAGRTLDLCGIAKGYALDELGELLAAAGHGAFLIDLGGELLARGRHPSGRPWQVGIEDPRPGAVGIAEVLALPDLSVATSGDRENGYTLGARRYSHIIDPATRAPVAGTIASVSVLGAGAMQADAWATALMAAGSVAGPALARREGLSALFLLRDGGRLARVTTGSFDAYLA